MRDSTPADAATRETTARHAPPLSRADWPLACARSRRDVARVIHDSLGQLVAAAGMTVARLANPSVDEADVETQLSRLGGLVADLATAIRRIEAALHPALLDQAGLDAALRARLAHASEQAGCERWTAQVDDHIDAAPADRLMTYRLAESLVVTYLNAMRPCSVELTVQTKADGTQIQLTLHGDHLPVCDPLKADTGDDLFSFVSLSDWLGAAQATLHKAATGSAQLCITVTMPSHHVPEAA